MFVLDTNVVSELMRPAPAPAVLRWISSRPATALFTTAITQAEILYGIALLAPGQRRNALADAAWAMFRDDFTGRVLPFDGPAAEEFARIAAARRQLGRPIAQADAQIAAIAASRGAVVATRNLADFGETGIDAVDPWTG